jgi:hypothetical protein
MLSEVLGGKEDLRFAAETIRMAHSGAKTITLDQVP